VARTVTAIGSEVAADASGAGAYDAGEQFYDEVYVVDVAEFSADIPSWKTFSASAMIVWNELQGRLRSSVARGRAPGLKIGCPASFDADVLPESVVPMPD
jgi:hypothetical protein